MLDLFTNTCAKQDFFANGLMQEIHDGMDIYIASAFFTETNVIDDLIKRKCRLRIVVRLGFPTSPIALKHLLNHKNIESKLMIKKTDYSVFFRI